MKVNLEIDGQQIEAQPGSTVFEAARTNDIDIPGLCNYEKIKPYGVCRLCVVEVKKGHRLRTVASCAYPVEEGISVQTRSERIDRIRKKLLEFVLEQVPHVPEIVELARSYGVQPQAQGEPRNYCILCGKCVNYCAEVKGKHLVGFKGRGRGREVVFPEVDLVPPKECMECGECYQLCPTGVFPVVGGI